MCIDLKNGCFSGIYDYQVEILQHPVRQGLRSTK